MKTIKLGVALILMCFTSTYIFAQNEGDFELQKGSLLWSVNVGGGYAPILFDNTSINNTSISSDNKVGFIGDVNLSYLFSDMFGVSVGVGYSHYSKQLTVTNYSDEKIDIMDKDNMRYTLYVESDKTSEKHKLSYLDIPVKMIVHKKISSRTILTGGLGLKFGVPLSTKFRLEESNFTTRAFYTDLNFWLTDYEQQGLFTERKNWYPEDDFESKINVAIVVEGGVLIPVSKQVAINANAYFSYGINKSIKGKANNHLIEENAKYNGFQSFLGDANLMQVGIKIGVTGIL